MRTFRWLVVVSVVAGAIVGAVELYFALFVNPLEYCCERGSEWQDSRKSALRAFPFPFDDFGG